MRKLLSLTEVLILAYQKLFYELSQFYFYFDELFKLHLVVELIPLGQEVYLGFEDLQRLK